MGSYEAVPQELKSLRNWVVWRAPSKIPYNPADTQSGAKANDASTWASYDEAVDAATLENLAGIGFEFGGTDCAGIDFDNVLDNGDPEAYVVEILEQLGNPYCEISPSGTGLHAFIQCPKIPGTKRKFSNGEHYGAEIYFGREKGRYFTITGDRFSGQGVPKFENIDIPYLLLSQIHDVKFKKLWMGDASDYGEDQSRADLALAWRLAQQLDRNAALVEQAFNASKPGQREKWTSRQDYRDWTLTKACASKKEPIDVGVEPTGPSEMVTRTGDTIEPEIIRWLWRDRIPLGKITLFAGNPDNGKSLAANSIAARVTTGGAFPDNLLNETRKPAEVLMLIGEDDLADTAVPRLMSAGADMKKIFFIEITKREADPEVRLDMDIAGIEMVLEAHPDIRLLVIDPISNYLGDVNMVAEQEVRRILIPLKRMADRKNVAVILVMHLNKKNELEAISRVGGAMAFIGVARCSWLFIRDASSDEGEVKETFTMARIKNNLAKASGSGLSYEIKATEVFIPKENVKVWTPYVEWGSSVNMTADDAIAAKQGKLKSGSQEPQKAPAKDSDLDTAVNWLAHALQSGGEDKTPGTVSAKWLEEHAKEEEGISLITLRRAKKFLHVSADKVGKEWVWTLAPMNETAETIKGDDGASPDQTEMEIG